jgi:ATP/ADP translocase
LGLVEQSFHVPLLVLLLVLHQSLKDSIVVMAMGAEALPFLATLGTLPASLLFFNFYRTVLVRAHLLLDPELKLSSSSSSITTTTA